MTPLKKYIRPGVLRNFLRKAHEMAGGECPLAMKYDGEVVIVEGTDSMTGFGENEPGVLVAPLQYDDIHSGCVAIRVAPSCSSTDFGRLLDFIAYSIQELIDMERARRSIAEEALAKYRELALLHRSVPNINTSLHMRDVVSALIDECRLENYPGERGMIFLLEPGRKMFRLAVQFGFPFGSYLQPMAESALFNEVVHSGHGEIVNDLAKEKRWDNELPGLSSMILIPISSPNRCEGVLILASENTGVFEAAHRRSLSTLASVAGISVSNSFNFEGIQKLMNAILQALAEAIDSRDPFTAGHSERVAHLAVAFAHAMNEDGGHKGTVFSDDELREIYYAGILHDVGKIGIKEEVLTKRTRLSERRMEVVRARFQLMGQFDNFNWAEAYECLCDVNKAMTPESKDLEFIKSLGSRAMRKGETNLPYLHEDELEHLLLSYGNLTKDERKEIQRHPAESERILQHIPMHDNYSNMLTIIRQHHERMDGSGYPDGLKGDELLIQSRLMAIVDIYDAVTQERHYKPAYTRSEAVKILREEVATGKLDADLTAFFLNNIERIETLSDQVKVTKATHISALGNLSGL
ncbi:MULTISPECIES: HD domain-containing phosphohydrolase [unclassified Pseudodesulfovibrio]|uniref:HD-GYP domain-containing protein n=1 Tax=unclassified Pseudodesulfovibrio TaxID=2661612 RepID=UPI000FEB95B1|nr:MULTISPECIES: HD domain-containing phosphohydrolase [unclassified Pseudodesulfovibrio]MCJ2164449.1 HD domain-containing protein [Pseudodesulfovibrio sp. S3-i]RWU04651.1 HD domain-containing protein [Pseudodesulfovibrio sp. S3]